MKLLKEYKFTIVLAFVMLGIYLTNNLVGTKAFKITLTNIKEMLSLVPPIFVLIGLLDTWVPKESMIKFMGQNSGIKGIIIAFLLGSAAAGPLYVAFPIAALLLKKGARLAYVLFFLGVWTSTKLPIVLYETVSLGLKFTVIHIGISIPAFLLIAFFIEKIISQDSISLIYQKAELL
ncbi:MAG: permease [Thermoanaerobacteraceae bacterium]|nr:permease [Thermoanaerobacteraceae bacterium]